MKIIASKREGAVPSPYNKYYNAVDPSTVVEEAGITLDQLASAESLDGYDFTHVNWLQPKDEYREKLELAALDTLEQVKDADGATYIGFALGEKFLPVSVDEIEDTIGDNQESGWEELASKSVYDSDGFTTDYTLWKWLGDPDEMPDREIYVCMFGDKELYGPNHDYCDYATDNEEDAREWFDNYSTDEDGNILESTCVDASVDTGSNYWYMTKHGLGPGMMPNDVKIVDLVEDGWDTYLLLDRMLTTEELKLYDMKEQAPAGR